MQGRLSTSKRSARGITLIEVIIAILVLAIGTLAAVRTMDQSRLELGGARDRLLAQLVASNRAAEIRVVGLAAGANLPASVQQGPFEWRIATQSKATQGGVYQVQITVTGAGRPGAVLTTFANIGPPP